MANSEVSRDEVFLLVDSRNVRFLDFLANHLDVDTCVRVLYCEGEGLGKLCLVTYRNTVGVLLSDTLCFRLALLEGVLVLELGTHVDGRMDLLDVCGCMSMEVDEVVKLFVGV